ncbi:hypothetical protein HOLleu_01042 [Holothuria leucospilota]|uniref:Uncharacterized protein n=1 Tax=Holothuria leucospilota TaxID=206669 RepID=A0A9Q1HK17_HOLLE|nr:hypothetical protein HOLleu_01042 [Holothuria leucospilota]
MHWFLLSSKPKRNTGNINCDVLQSLTTWEQTLCNKLIRIEVKGKKGRKVPVLLTGEMTESLELLMKHRNSVCIRSDNVFVFARANGDSQMCIRGSDCLRKLAIKSCVKIPANLTSTKLRKQIATVSQIFCLRDNELDILAGFLGHDIRVHRDYYRLPEDALQTAKVARLLMLMEKGLVADFKDKTLSEIEVALDGPSYDDVDDGSGKEESEVEEDEEEEEDKEDVNGDEEEKDVERTEQQSEERREGGYQWGE